MLQHKDFKNMIKVYGMRSCPDCVAVHEQVKNDSRYEMIEIGENIAKLKEFLRLRVSSPVFDKVRK